MKKRKRKETHEKHAQNNSKVNGTNMNWLKKFTT
jgi:hypothetical protein